MVHLLEILVLLVLCLIKIGSSFGLTCVENPDRPFLKLKNKLFCDYDDSIRPNLKSNVEVTTIYQLTAFEYVQANKEISLHSVIVMKWNDERLKWDPNEFDGIKTFTVKYYYIWMPDLTSRKIYQRYESIFVTRSKEYKVPKLRMSMITTKTKNAQSAIYDTCSPGDCTINSTGLIFCRPVCTHTALCSPIHTNWPYDNVFCTIQFSAWKYRLHEIHIKEKNTNVSVTELQHYKVDSSQWHRVFMTAENKNITKKSDGSILPVIEYTIYLERHAYIENILVLVPALVLTTLILASFWLLPTSSERLSISLATLFIHFMFMQHLGYVVPQYEENVPKILLFFRDSLVMATVFLIETILVRGLLSWRQVTLPIWIKSITQPLLKIEFIKIIADNSVDSNSNENEKILLTFVKLIDFILFLIFLIVYFYMIVNDLPSKSMQSKDIPVNF